MPKQTMTIEIRDNQPEGTPGETFGELHTGRLTLADIAGAIGGDYLITVTISDTDGRESSRDLSGDDFAKLFGL